MRTLLFVFCILLTFGAHAQSSSVKIWDGVDTATVTGGALDVNATLNTAGLATTAKQDTGNASLASIDGKITAVNTGAVVISSGSLTCNAGTNLNTSALATSANQSTMITSLQLLDDAIMSGGAAVTVATQPVSMVGVRNSAGNATVLQAASDAADALATSSAGTTLRTVALGFMYNGSTYDRVRGDTTNGLDVDVTRLPSVAQATAANLNAQVVGELAHDAVDSGNPVKIGGKVSTTAPSPVANADRVDGWWDAWGRLVTSDYDVELGSNIGSTGLRDRLTAQRYTVLADSVADGLAAFWTTTTASGGTATVTGGEGLIQTSANATGSAQITSTTTSYFPGQVQWLNSAIRFGDTGSAGNIRRIGVYTVSGTTPQDGFYYELNGTTLNAVVAKAGVATATASTSWSRFSVAPFTLDTNFHSFEIRYTANTVWFYVDNVLRHVVSGTTSPVTATLNFPMTIVSVNTSGATNRLIAVRNIGMGRFGDPQQQVDETGLSAVRAIAVGGGTPHDSVDSGNPLKIGGVANATAPAAVANGDRVNAWFTTSGALNVTDRPATSGGLSLVRSLGLGTTATAVKGTAGQIYGYYLFNGAASVRYFKIYNIAAGSVTVGTSTPTLTIPLPAGAAANVEFSQGIAFSTAIAAACTTGVADADTGAPGASDCIANFFYN